MTPVLALLTVQVGLLWLIWRLSIVGTDDFVYRMLNPFNWLCGFYALWFLLPQFTGLLFDYHMLGMTVYRTSDLRQIFIEGQLYLILFLLAIVVAELAFASVFFRHTGRLSLSSMMRIDYRLSYSFFLYVFFVLGMIANAYIAYQHLGNVDSFRGDIVKTLPGRIATAVGYLGAFAFAYLFVRSYLKRRYVLLALLCAVFMASLFFTGARGRLLFPLAILTLFLLCRRGNIPVLRATLFSAAALLLLLSLDPINKMLKHGPESYVFSAEQFFSPLLYKRNFDGFANFSLIVSHDLVPHDLSYLREGGRDPFMYTYFPAMYETGVGTGSTTPGLLWFLGGWPALLIGGIVFGMILCAINVWLRLNRSNLLLWSYLFGMQWFCAIGGNLIESLDKMLVAMIGPVIIYMAHLRDESAPPVPSPTLSPDLPTVASEARAESVSDDTSEPVPDRATTRAVAREARGFDVVKAPVRAPTRAVPEVDVVLQ